jgi:hypothetical protein
MQNKYSLFRVESITKRYEGNVIVNLAAAGWGQQGTGRIEGVWGGASVSIQCPDDEMPKLGDIFMIRASRVDIPAGTHLSDVADKILNDEANKDANKQTTPEPGRYFRK